MLRVTPLLDGALTFRPITLDQYRSNPISTIALAAIGIFASFILLPFPLDILATAVIISLLIYNLSSQADTGDSSHIIVVHHHDSSPWFSFRQGLGRLTFGRDSVIHRTLEGAKTLTRAIRPIVSRPNALGRALVR
ncbi:MAG: hypothetical protein HZB76_03860 [Chlamydiae bacterium]|nr:hypothetical protein [Chlamydiota bacterium]